jgi:hypothetical protein
MADSPKPAPAAEVPVYVPGLGVRMVDAKDAPQAVADGARLATSQEHHEAKLEARYGSGVEGYVAPVLAGAARGFTLGASDAAIGAIGGEGAKRRLLDYQEYSPTASTIGELGGIAAGALIGDEAGLASLPGVVGRLGAGVETGAARALGGGMLARGAAAAARGATEGAIYETGKRAGDAALRDEDLTLEKALSAAGHGALFGAGANVLFAGAGGTIDRILGRSAEEAAPALARSTESGLARAESGSVREGIGETLGKASDVKTIKALGGSAGDLRALENNTPGGFRKVAQDIRGDVEATTGKSIGFHNRESLHDYATARVDELGDKLGGMLKKLDASGSAIAPDVESFAQKVRAELVAPNTIVDAMGARMVKPGQQQVVHAAESWLKEVEGAFGKKAPTFTEWQQARIALDKQVNFAARAASPEMGALKQIRSLMEKELETSGEAAAKNVGQAFSDEYRATKSLYQSVRKAQELTERGVARELANNSFGLGATMGGLTGLVTGGPVTGALMGVAGKVVKDRGDMLAADLLHRASNLLGVQQLAARTNAQMAHGVAGLLGTKPVTVGAAALRAPVRSVAAPMGVALSGKLHKDFDNVTSAVTKTASNPMAVTAKVAAALGPEAGRSPKLAAAATQMMLGDIAFLQSKIPPPRQDPFTLQPHLQPKTRASDGEKVDFMRYAEALDDPLVMLKRAKNGTLTPATVEAVKERRPLLYDEMRQEVMRSLVDSKSQLPYGRRIALGILLDLPTDASLAPDFVQALQATYAAPDSAAEEPPSPQLSRLDVASTLMTGTQSATSEGTER